MHEAFLLNLNNFYRLERYELYKNNDLQKAGLYGLINNLRRWKKLRGLEYE